MPVSTVGGGAPREHDIELRDQIERICLEHRRQYGYRRVLADLKRKGWTVGETKVRRVLRADDLLALRKRKFLHTTDSQHALSVFPNWAATLEVDGLNQLWVADITCIRLADEFVYLAVGALRMALGKRTAPNGLIHHSDRGLRELHENAEAGGDLLLRLCQLNGTGSGSGNVPGPLLQPAPFALCPELPSTRRVRT